MRLDRSGTAMAAGNDRGAAACGARPAFTLRLGGRTLALGPRTAVMGIVNVTPDSFSDGGRFLDPGAAIEHGLRLAAAGADLLDESGGSPRAPAPRPCPQGSRSGAWFR